MTDTEFDILDELYFVTSFQTLAEATSIEKSKLKDALKTMIGKGWIRCFTRINEEVRFEPRSFEENFDKYHYLATKKGLLVHNGRN